MRRFHYKQEFLSEGSRISQYTAGLVLMGAFGMFWAVSIIISTSPVWKF